MKPTLADKATISTEVLLQEVGGEAVLLDLKSEKYFGLDEVGTRIWQLLREKGTLQQVYDALLGEYDVESAQLRADLLDLVDSMAEAGIVVVQSSPASERTSS